MCFTFTFYETFYLFVVTLSFSESEDGEVWYYSTQLQLEELLLLLDQNEMEVALYRELSDYKDEIVRQMELTESITNQYKGNKKSYLEMENSKSDFFFNQPLSFFPSTTSNKINQWHNMINSKPDARSNRNLF